MKPALSGAFFLARKDLAILFRSKETYLWAFVMPVLFFYVIGTITSGFAGGPPARDKIGLVVPPDAGVLAAQLAGRLNRAGLDVVQAPDAAKQSASLTLPAGFSASLEAGRPVELDYRHVDQGMQAGYGLIRVQRAIYGTLADLVVLAQDGKSVSAETLAARLKEPLQLTLSSEPATHRRTAPVGYDQSVPGTMVMFGLLVMMTSGSVHLLLERKSGILRRLASSPMPRAAVVLGKWGSRFTLGAIQLAFAALTATWWLHVHWGPSPIWIAIVLLSFIALSTTLGLLLGNECQSEGQVIGIGVVVSNVFAALGGCMWPVEITPEWTQKLALILPTGWAMDALHKLMIFADPPASVLPHIGILLATTLAAALLLARRFRFQ